MIGLAVFDGDCLLVLLEEACIGAVAFPAENGALLQIVDDELPAVGAPRKKLNAPIGDQVNVVGRKLRGKIVVLLPVAQACILRKRQA